MEKKEIEITEESREIIDKYKLLMKRGVTLRKLASETGVSYHYFYKMLVEVSVPPFASPKMIKKANAFLQREDVMEILHISNVSLFE